MMIDIWRNVLFDWKFPYYFCILVFHMIHKHMKLCKNLVSFGTKIEAIWASGKTKSECKYPMLGFESVFFPSFWGYTFWPNLSKRWQLFGRSKDFLKTTHEKFAFCLNKTHLEGHFHWRNTKKCFATLRKLRVSSVKVDIQSVFPWAKCTFMIFH